MAAEFIVSNFSNDEAECDYFELSIDSGSCKVTVPLYAIDGFKEFGRQLIDFPRHFYDYAVFELGEDKPNDDFYFLLKAFCYNPNGQIVIQVIAKNSGDALTTYHVAFSLLLEAALVNRLGVSLNNWDPTQERRFVWSAAR
ncbi:hypothetical protein M0L20_05915 [Spirosoma sp. RP8]|uniref:Uncharacterized protein n=1 Tax=Spirosoma liriopis TaxID=2937440 RepID=A0ABT0HHA8_9BACT|nr:hypothetical protein [Spirosoma liriopis]MCK8491380.1 hypothetical protein [Spirosoma liriopis]